MKKIITVLMVVILIAASVGTVFSFGEEASDSGEEAEVIVREYTVPAGLRFKYEPVIQENGADCEMKYMWSKNAIGSDNCLLEGDHTYTVRVRYEGAWWQKVEVITLHVSKDAVIPECTVDESKTDFGTDEKTVTAASSSGNGNGLIITLICILAAALVVLGAFIVKELLQKKSK